MPEITVRLQWPDGTIQRVYSPSLVVSDHLQAGSVYPVEELLPRMRTALTEASDRVQAAYGFPCSRAAASLAAVQARGSDCGSGDVMVLGFE
jgi:uncharacterized repeat protein (TIGR04042 family)